MPRKPGCGWLGSAWLAVRPHAWGLAREVADAATAAVHQLPGGSRGNRDAAARRHELQTHPTVDAFPQKVGMADMAGVLLDHVDQYLP